MNLTEYFMLILLIKVFSVPFLPMVSNEENITSVTPSLHSIPRGVVQNGGLSEEIDALSSTRDRLGGPDTTTREGVDLGIVEEGILRMLRLQRRPRPQHLRVPDYMGHLHNLLENSDRARPVDGATIAAKTPTIRSLTPSSKRRTTKSEVMFGFNALRTVPANEHVTMVYLVLKKSIAGRRNVLPHLKTKILINNFIFFSESFLNGDYIIFDVTEAVATSENIDENIFLKVIMDHNTVDDLYNFQLKNSRGPILVFFANFPVYFDTNSIRMLEQMQTKRAFKRSVSGATTRQDAMAAMPSPSNDCHLEKWTVEVADLGWDDWIYAPRTFAPNYCGGGCPQLLISGVHNATNHAFIKNIFRGRVGPDHPKYDALPKACCVPIRLRDMSILYMDDDNQAVEQIVYESVATACGCL